MHITVERLWDHSWTPAGWTPITDTSTAVATVERPAFTVKIHIANYAFCRFISHHFGRRVSLGKLASFSFRGKGKARPPTLFFRVLMIPLGRTSQSCDPFGGSHAVVNWERMKFTRADGIFWDQTCIEAWYSSWVSHLFGFCDGCAPLWSGRVVSVEVIETLFLYETEDGVSIFF